jgi:hypothetical protein
MHRENLRCTICIRLCFSQARKKVTEIMLCDRVFEGKASEAGVNRISVTVDQERSIRAQGLDLKGFSYTWVEENGRLTVRHDVVRRTPPEMADVMIAKFGDGAARGHQRLQRVAAALKH